MSSPEERNVQKSHSEIAHDLGAVAAVRVARDAQLPIGALVAPEVAVRATGPRAATEPQPAIEAKAEAGGLLETDRQSVGTHRPFFDSVFLSLLIHTALFGGFVVHMRLGSRQLIPAVDVELVTAVPELAAPGHATIHPVDRADVAKSVPSGVVQRSTHDEKPTIAAWPQPGATGGREIADIALAPYDKTDASRKADRAAEASIASDADARTVDFVTVEPSRSRPAVESKPENSDASAIPEPDVASPVDEVATARDVTSDGAVVAIPADAILRPVEEAAAQPRSLLKPSSADQSARIVADISADMSGNVAASPARVVDPAVAPTSETVEVPASSAEAPVSIVVAVSAPDKVEPLRGEAPIEVAFARASPDQIDPTFLPSGTDFPLMPEAQARQLVSSGSLPAQVVAANEATLSADSIPASTAVATKLNQLKDDFAVETKLGQKAVDQPRSLKASIEPDLTVRLVVERSSPLPVSKPVSLVSMSQPVGDFRTAADASPARTVEAVVVALAVSPASGPAPTARPSDVDVAAPAGFDPAVPAGDNSLPHMPDVVVQVDSASAPANMVSNATTEKPIEADSPTSKTGDRQPTGELILKGGLLPMAPNKQFGS